MYRLKISILVVIATLLPLYASAQDAPGLAKHHPHDVMKTSGLVDGRMGLGMLDEDLFVTINVGTALTFGKLGIGIQVPLRLRVQDNDPKNDEVIRKEDWDEFSDWTRVLRYIEWGKPSDWLYTRVGVLAGTSIGHGTIVDQYYNVIDSDHYQTGVQLNLDLDVAGGQFFLDNIIDPNIFALRGFVRPFRFFKMPAILNQISAGVTVAVDTAAPIEKDNPDQKQQFASFNADGELRTSTTQVTLLGLDLDWQVLSTEVVAITPYMDFNILGNTGGHGFHLGIFSTFQLGSSAKLGTRAEYRSISADYSPSYINSWYEVERVDFLDGKTKFKYLDDRHAAGEDEAKHGYVASAELDLLKVFKITGTYEDYQGANNSNLLIKLGLPWISNVRANVYYAKRNFDGFDEAFELDRGLLVAEAKYKFYGPIFAYAVYSREWRLNQETDTSNAGRYETVNDWSTGVGAEFSF